jgi:hypothetical protein
VEPAKSDCKRMKIPGRKMTKMNQRMVKLLTKMGVDLSVLRSLPTSIEVPAMKVVGESVLLQAEFARSMHITLKDFEDRTGYECFVNHVHIPWKKGRRSFLSVLGFIAAIKLSLDNYSVNKRFLILASFSDGECTIRFHQVRQGEKWLADDLEGYKTEALLQIETGVGCPSLNQ